MENRFIHTPEGVRDIYGQEYAKKLEVQKLLHSKLQAYGFMDIQTPTFEFFDVFSSEIGTTPSKELYKFFDKEGNTLVLRPDFTPSMARCAAKYFMEEQVPIRFCYLGNTFTNTSNLQGKLKEVTQMGAELIGEGSVEADAEMISLVIESLLNAGLKDFQVSIGQVEFFKGICEVVGLEEEAELELRELISNKNYFGAEELLIHKNIAKEHRDVILKVTDMFGSIESLKAAKEMVTNERSRKAIEHLEKLYEVLCLYKKEQYVSFDLGMLSKYNYYTGVIFKGYTYGVGDAIVTGGRYDNLLSRFGKDAPAIGFVIVVDDLMEAFKRQKIKVELENKKTMVFYDAKAFEKAISVASKLRAEGVKVEMLSEKETDTLEKIKEVAKSHLVSKIICVRGNEEIVEVEVEGNGSK